jgi:hypothetical protein
MIDPRIYRAALVPAVLALIVVVCALLYRGFRRAGWL